MIGPEIMWYLLASFVWGMAAGMVVEQARARRDSEREMVDAAEEWLERREQLRSDSGR